MNKAVILELFINIAFFYLKAKFNFLKNNMRRCCLIWLNLILKDKNIKNVFKI